MIANFNMSDLYDFFVVTDSLIFPNGREMKNGLMYTLTHNKSSYKSTYNEMCFKH